MAAKPPEPKVDLTAVTLALFRRGKRPPEIAELLDCALATVYRRLEKAREAEAMGKLPPAYAFKPRTECNCKDDPIKVGAKIVCVNCCASGWDFHPDLHAEALPRDKKAPAVDDLGGGKGRRQKAAGAC